MSILTRFALVSLLALGACATEPEADFTDERADANEVITYQRPEAPTEIEFAGDASSSESSLSISYGHCDEATTDEDGAIQINCPEKWSELAWLSISKETSQRMIDQGHTSLQFVVAVKDSTNEAESVRFGVHAISDDGTRTKVASEGNVFDGEYLAVTLEPVAYHVYMARGVNQSLIWNNGFIEVDLLIGAE